MVHKRNKRVARGAHAGLKGCTKGARRGQKEASGDLSVTKGG